MQWQLWQSIQKTSLMFCIGKKAKFSLDMIVIIGIG